MQTRHHILKLILSLTALVTSHHIAADDHLFDSTIPVLDMNEYFEETTRDKFVGELYDALKEVGFFAVVNTEVDTEILDNAYNSCFDFFSQPLEKKMKAFSPAANGQRGYVPGESAKGVSYGDFKEFYHVGRELNPMQLQALNMWQNIWPEKFSLRAPMNTLLKALEESMFPLEEAIAEAIGAPLDLFTKMTQDGDVLLRAIHYPKNPPEDRLWAAEHTDIDLFTILPEPPH